MRPSILAATLSCTVAVMSCSGTKESPPPAGGQAAPPAAPANPPAAPASPPAEPAATVARDPQPEPASPPTPPAPTFREVTIPEGTILSVALATPVSSDKSAVEDPLRGTLSKPIRVSGTVAAPTGSIITGSVLEADRSGRVKGRASIAFRFDRLVVRDEPIEIRTARVVREAAANRRDDVAKGGIGAGVGAIVGGIVGGGKGAAIGAGAGGAGAVLATRGHEVRLAAGTVVSVRLEAPITISVPILTKER
jgi:hypothetical protein